MAPFIPESKLENLHKYKYSAIDKSITSKWILNPFWNKLVLLFPKWIAPNTITFSGLCLILVNLATLLVLDPEYSDKELPRWAYFAFGIGLFAYQSLDAIDGKQARRTGMAGPLGEMFDHGCDAMNTTLEVIITCHALNLGRSWWTVASQAATLSNFYLTTWEEYHTGTLYLSAFSGPVEGILLIVAMYFITGVYGPAFWDQRPAELLHLAELMPDLAARQETKWLFQLGINDVFMIFSAFALAFNVAGSYKNVIVSRRKSHQSIYTPLLGLLPFVVQTAMLVAWLHGLPEIIRSSSAFVPFLGFWGLGFAYQVGRMILAHVTKQPFPLWNGMMAWTAVGMLDANLGRFLGSGPVLQSTPERISVFIAYSFALALFAYGSFVYTVINQITNYMGIACFTVRKKDEAGRWVEAAKVNAAAAAGEQKKTQ